MKEVYIPKTRNTFMYMAPSGVYKNSFYRYCYKLDKKKVVWVLISVGDYFDGYYSNFITCKSIRAFRRRLKKVPNGIKFTLAHRNRSRNFYGKGSLIT